MQPLNEEFLLSEIPEYHPLSRSYLDWWKEQKLNCIEGFWASGKWMPGKLYFYVNYGIIRLNKDGAKTKSYGTPNLRDIEWELSYYWEETRGFSGFQLDEEFTCLHAINEPHNYIGGPDKLRREHPEAYRKDGSPKTYVPPRTYLRTTHSRNLGSPIYKNPSQNFFMLGPRGYGKSYFTGVALTLHEWLFDGAQHYDPAKPSNSSQTTQVIVGAGDAKYSNDILSKTRTALERLPGSQEIANKFYPNPFFKQHKGSWGPGKLIRAEYEVKHGGQWRKKGSFSEIKNRTFKDNPYAAQGSRASLMVFEEIGMFNNLRESYAASVDVMKDGANKYGSGIFIGTGGDMESGTQDAHYMFYHPSEFDCLVFEDMWENQGQIACFIPAEMGLDQYKDDEGNTIWEQAAQYLEKQRKKLSSSTGSSLTLRNHIIYHPRKPSEIFLIEQGTILPAMEASQRLTRLRAGNVENKIAKKVELFYDSDSEYNGISYQIDTSNKLTHINTFPWTHKDREGATVIYELPIIDPELNKIPPNLYIIGHDPTASDSETGQSLSSIYVLKTSLNPSKYGHYEIVAEYVGRPYTGRNTVNETLLKLSLFYGNATIYFENSVGNVKEYFEKRKKLSLLAKQPQTILTKKASFSSSAPTIYGYPMANRQMKMDGLIYMRDFLLEERGTDEDGNVIRNVDVIPSQGLLQEIVAHNLNGNYDRIMGFMGCIIGLEESYNKLKQKIQSKTNPLDFISKNQSIFNSQPKHYVNSI